MAWVYFTRTKNSDARASSLNVERKFYEFPPIVSEFRCRRPRWCSDFLRSATSLLRSREKKMRGKRGERKERKRKEKRPGLGLRCWCTSGIRSLRFSVRTARARVYRGAVGIVIYERSFVEFADDILPRGPVSWPVAARSCNVVYRTSVDFDTSCAVSLICHRKHRIFLC